MTLIQNFNVGGIISVLSSDTRQVATVFGKPIRIKNAGQKMKPLSPYCLAAAGGKNEWRDALFMELDNVKGKFLDDYWPAIPGIIEQLKKEHDSRGKGLESEDDMQALITGFNQNGTTGTISIKSGKPIDYKFEIQDSNETYYSIVSPSQDETQAVIENVNLQSPNTLEEVPNVVLQLLYKVQASFLQINEESVSDEFLYHVLFRNPENGEVVSHENKTLIPREWE